MRGRGNQSTLRNLKSKSEIYFDSFAKDDKKHSSTKFKLDPESWRLLGYNLPRETGSENDTKLQYTSTTLKQKRRQLRESLLMSEKMFSLFDTAKEASEIKESANPDLEKTKQNGFGISKEKKRSVLATSELNTFDFDSQPVAVKGRTKSKRKSCTSSMRRRQSWRRKTDYINSSLGGYFLQRNDPHSRLSVRGTRIFGRKKNYRAYPSLGEDVREPERTLSFRCSSLPSNLSFAECMDYEFWHSRFVQNRVKRLEEDLAAKCEEYAPWNYDFDVQSLCSLELDRIIPDGDDYRIAYLSSVCTSQESSLDYMEDTISNFGMGTLDIKRKKKRPLVKSDDNLNTYGMATLDIKLSKKQTIDGTEDWDLSFSSFEDKSASSDEDESEFFTKYTTNSNNDSQTKCYATTFSPNDHSTENPQTDYKTDVNESRENAAWFSYSLGTISPNNSSEDFEKNYDSSCDYQQQDFETGKEYSADFDFLNPFIQHEVQSYGKDGEIKCAKSILFPEPPNKCFTKCKKYDIVEVTTGNYFEEIFNIGSYEPTTFNSSIDHLTANSPRLSKDVETTSAQTRPIEFKISSYELLSTPFSIIYAINSGINQRDLPVCHFANKSSLSLFQSSLKVETKISNTMEYLIEDEMKQVGDFLLEMIIRFFNQKTVPRHFFGRIPRRKPCETNSYKITNLFVSNHCHSRSKHKEDLNPRFETDYSKRIMLIQHFLPGLFDMHRAVTCNNLNSKFCLVPFQNTEIQKHRNFFQRIRNQNFDSITDILQSPILNLYYGPTECIYNFQELLPRDSYARSNSAVLCLNSNSGFPDIYFEALLNPEIFSVITTSVSDNSNINLHGRMNINLLDFNFSNVEQYFSACASLFPLYSIFHFQSTVGRVLHPCIILNNLQIWNRTDKPISISENDEFDNFPCIITTSKEFQNGASETYLETLLSAQHATVFISKIRTRYNHSSLNFNSFRIYKENFGKKKIEGNSFKTRNRKKKLVSLGKRNLNDFNSASKTLVIEKNKIRNLPLVHARNFKISSHKITRSNTLNVCSRNFNHFGSIDSNNLQVSDIHKKRHTYEFKNSQYENQALVKNFHKLPPFQHNLKIDFMLSMYSTYLNFSIHSSCLSIKIISNNFSRDAKKQSGRLDTESENQNRQIRSNLRSETEIVARVQEAGETPESRIAAACQSGATSQTGSAAFVECLFPSQFTSICESKEALLLAGSCELSLSVPAVRRVAKYESSLVRLPDDQWVSVDAPCLTTTDGADQLLQTAENKQDSCCENQGICVTSDETNGSWYHTHGYGYTLISDYPPKQKLAHLVYDNEDYVYFGHLPIAVQEQLTPAFSTVNSCDNYVNSCDRKSAGSDLQGIMAACDDDPRLINKVIRTPGRNISKLKRFFDSRECVATDSNDICNRSATNSKAISSQCQSRVASVFDKHSMVPNSDSQLSSEKPETKVLSNCSISSLKSNSFSENACSETLKENQISVTTACVDDIQTQREADSNENGLHNENDAFSDIPYCRKVTSGDLWKNVDLGVESENGGLWNFTQNYTYCDSNINSEFLCNLDNSRQVSNSFVASTAELHNLIAVSRAELSKKKEPSLPDRSTLESYFTSFENSNSVSSVPLNDESKHSLSSQNHNSDIFHSSFDCDGDEMTFDDEEAALSDTSSEEELRCHPAATNTHYLPAYALHTIIEESCEESERDSRTATPTNDALTSKLERYFSWDIINDTDCDFRKKDDDASTLYSDSLSEGSGSLNDDASKEIDPSQLASSRLEKYFTSGLVGNENYFYPDDAEFLDDAPVSDFEEDSIHQKISRSALLSSLETKPFSEKSDSICFEVSDSVQSDVSVAKDNEIKGEISSLVASDFQKQEEITVPETESNHSDLKQLSVEPISASSEIYITKSECSANIDALETLKETTESTQQDKFNDLTKEKLESDTRDTIINNSSEIENPIKIISSNNENSSPTDVSQENNEILPHVSNSMENMCVQKSVVNKEQLAIDAQAIIRKLLAYFADSASESFKNSMELDYISAWQILESEIERLMQSISPTASLENNSCNSSTIDSNNSDYGSDTIESMDCMTDDDDNLDSRNRSNSKCPLVDILNSAYQFQPDCELGNFNISDETLSIWKRLIQSLQKDSLDKNSCDANAEARLYIRDQIVTLMHTVTVTENNFPGKEKNVDLFNINQDQIFTSSLMEEGDTCDINEAFNVNITNSKVLTHLSENMLNEMAPVVKTESSDEGVSFDSNENLHAPSEISKCASEKQICPEVTSSSDSGGYDICENIKSNSHLSAKMQDSEKSDESSMPVTFEMCKPSHVVDDTDGLVLDREDNSQFNERTDHKSGNDGKFSVFVDIELGDETVSVTERKLSVDKSPKVNEAKEPETKGKRSSLHVWLSNETPKSVSDSAMEETNLPDEVTVSNSIPEPSHESCSTSSVTVTETNERTSHDMDFYPYKSSDDIILNTCTRSEELVDVPNFKSLKRSVKKAPITNTLSKSTNNILQTFSSPETKFSTLQIKPQKSKVSMNPSNSSSRQFASLFSPSAVFKRITGTKSNNQNSESTIPAKYLKKYARSSSIDNESLFGAVSMPQLNFPKPGDSYSALGLYPETDRDSSLTLDDESEARAYTCSQSVLSLGSHSASMTSVYSAAGCHYGYVTISGDVLFGLNYNQKSQMMEVFVKQCRNLAAVDIRRNKSDPYVKCYLLPDKTRSGKRKTKTKKNTLNPVFNELLRFPVLKHELESRTLWLSVWNSDLFGRNDFLGEITLPLGYRLLDSPTLRWYPLQERMESLTSPLNYKGELFLALKYVPRDLSLESRFRPAPVISLRGALHVLVKEARNISVNRSSGALDAFCKSYLLPDKSKSSKQKTPVVKKSRHPKWYYTVIYEDLSIDELKERSLELTVWDHDKLSSNEFMGGVRLNTGTGLYHGVSVEWMDARRDEAALWQAMLESPNMWVDGCLPLRSTMQFRHS